MFDETGLPEPLPSEPLVLLAAWLAEAWEAKQVPNPNAMILATVRDGGQPAARVVLCKAVDVDAGELVFFTNYESAKAREIEASPRVCSVFHWDHVERQARVYGTVRRGTAGESDAYFASRPVLSRIGAWASQQSRPIASREDLVMQAAEIMDRFNVTIEQAMANDPAVKIPRPSHWGAFRIRAEAVELWVGSAGRLHDRAVWERGLGQDWRVQRLQP